MNDHPAQTGSEDELRVGDLIDDSGLRMRAALQQMSIGVSAAEVPSGAFLFLNDAGVRILGTDHAPHDLPSYSEFGAEHADGRPYAPEDYPLARAAATGETVEREPMLYRRPDGSLLHLEVSAARVFDEAGQPVLAICSFEDLTERERVRGLLEMFIEAVPGVVYAKDRQGRMLVANGGTAQLVGKRVADIVGRTDAEFLEDQAQASAVMATDERIMRSGETEQVEEDVSFPDGRHAIWLSTKAPLRDTDGAIIGLIGSSVDITARKEAEAALTASEERFRFALEAAGGIGTWDWNIQEDAIRTSAQFARMYGVDPVRAEQGLPLAEYVAGIHPDDRERIAALIEEAVASGGDFLSEYRILGVDGEVRWVVARGRCFRDEAGRPTRFPGVTFDITDRRRTEQALREASSRLEAILANTRMAVFLMDDRQHCVFANAAAEKLTGYSFAELQGRPLHDVIHNKKPDGSPYPLEECPIDRAFPERAQTEGEELFVARDGSLYPVAFTASPVLDDEDRPIGTIIEARGIAEEKADQRRQAFRLELVDALRREAEPRRIMQAAVDALGRHLDVARVGYGLIRDDGETVDLETEYTNGVMPLAGTYPLATFGPGNIANLQAGRTSVYTDVETDPGTAGIGLNSFAIRSLVAVPQTTEGRLRAALYLNHDKPRLWSPEDVSLVEEVASRVWDAVERARAVDDLRALNADLEQRVSDAVAEREKAEDALRQSQKMEAVGQLTGGIAHDFNNLLTIVTGNIDMASRALEAAGAPDTRARRALDNAMKGAERASALTQRLLAFSRRQPLAPKPLDADRLVAGMSDLLNRALGETVKLEIVTSPGLWRTEVDPNQLENAILNLAVNARDAMPAGGTLTIETANARLDDEYAAQHAEVAPGQYVVIAVTDTGEGMARETLARVFEPFFTTKDVGKGTGLGLSQVYGFTKQSGGHVKVYSEEGQGTTVKIYLPRLISEDDVESSGNVVDGLEVSPRRETILAVEDDDDVRAYTVECLRELGYRVLEAHDGASAIRLMERQGEPIDLLFTDVVMPGMTGSELADELRRRQPGLRVLYTSGYTRNAIVHGGRLDEGVEMIAKPFTFQALAAKVRDMLEAGRTKRVLVVEAEPTLRGLVVEALAGVGYAADEAATSAEALMTVRAAQGRYDAVVLDAGLPDKAADALAAEMRALHADLPLLLAAAENAEGLAAQFADDRCVAVLPKPFKVSRLTQALHDLGLRCGAASRNGR